MPEMISGIYSYALTARRLRRGAVPTPKTVMLPKNGENGGNGSNRRGAGHHDAMHQPPLAFGIVGVGLVHGAAVVPDHHVALAPDMAVLEARLDGMGDQPVEQRVALGPLQ